MEDWRTKSPTKKKLSKKLLSQRAKQKILIHWFLYSMVLLWPLIGAAASGGMMQISFVGLAPSFFFAIFSGYLIKNYIPAIIVIPSATPLLIFFWFTPIYSYLYGIMGQDAYVLFVILGGTTIPVIAAAIVTQMIIQNARYEIDDRNRKSNCWGIHI